MSTRLFRSLLVVLAALVAGSARANDFIPDLSSPVVMASTTTFKIVLKEQARIEVPPLVVFNVNNVAVDTPQEGTALLKATNIVLLPTHRLRIDIAPMASNFVDSLGHNSWDAERVAWTRVSQTNGVLKPGNFGGAGVFINILTCNLGAKSCEGVIKFALSADAGQSVAGEHVLFGKYRVSTL